MRRARTAWIAACVLLLTAAAYLVVRRRSRPAPALATAPPVPLPAPERAQPVEAGPTEDGADADKWQRFEASTEPPSDDLEVPARESPLPTWVRVGIVAVALLVFFAVSLLATKRG